MDLFTIGLPTALSFDNLLYCFLGVFLGTLIGVLPGVGPLATISLLMPISMYLEPTGALVMLAGVYYGAQYGGSITAVLLNLPGESSSAITALDGYQMRLQGRAGVAIFITAVASFIGGGIGITILISCAPYIVQMSRMFGAAEYFAAMLFALIMAPSITQGSMLKGYLMVAVGLLLGCVGLDVNSGIPRYSFGAYQLYEGISIAILAMGLFGIAEIVDSIRSQKASGPTARISLRAMIPTRQDWKDMVPPTFRGSAVGCFFGALPGVGSSAATYCAYALERRTSKNRLQLGKGVVDGVAAPEAANNAAVQTAFVPTLLLGIPGSATMAVMLGALMIHGIAPGPALMSQQPQLFWGLIASFWIGNIILVLLNIPLVGIWVSILRIPYTLLYPAIIVLVCVGAYSLRFNAFDVWMVLLFGFVGYGMRLLDLEPAPLLMGFVLGPMIEENFRRAMLLAYGDVTTLLSKPIVATILTCAALIILLNAMPQITRRLNGGRSS